MLAAIAIAASLAVAALLVWQPWVGGPDALLSTPPGAPPAEQAAGDAERSRVVEPGGAAPGFAPNLTGPAAVDRPAYPPRPVRPDPAQLEDPIEPLDAVDPEASGYRAIGEPLDVEDVDLTLEEPLWIGEPLDADDPEAGVSEDLESEVIAVGAPLDADSPPEEAIPAAPPRHIGEPLDADAPEDL